LVPNRLNIEGKEEKNCVRSPVQEGQAPEGSSRSQVLFEPTGAEGIGLPKRESIWRVVRTKCVRGEGSVAHCFSAS